MFEQLQIILGVCSDSTAKVYLRPQVGSTIRTFTASLYGPQCDFSRTLASDFRFRGTNDLDQEALITEPCYWTPALPFRYELKLQSQDANGDELEHTVSVGLRRFDSQGNSFRLEGRRSVLRGASCDTTGIEVLDQARSAETALLVERFDGEFCAAADRLGVPLVLDLRSAGDSLYSTLDRLDWSASILLALVSAEQLAQPNLIRHWPRQCLLAHGLTAQSTPDELGDPNTEALAIELDPGERPPGWLARNDRPVVAIRHGMVNDDLQAARRDCHPLQAELAPEFNLAGYFVAP